MIWKQVVPIDIRITETKTVITLMGYKIYICRKALVTYVYVPNALFGYTIV